MGKSIPDWSICFLLLYKEGDIHTVLYTRDDTNTALNETEANYREGHQHHKNMFFDHKMEQESHIGEKILDRDENQYPLEIQKEKYIFEIPLPEMQIEKKTMRETWKKKVHLRK